MACVLEGHTLWFHLPLSDNATWNLLAVTGRGGELIDTSTIPPTNVTGQTSCEVWLENDTDCVDNAPALDGITNGMAASLCDGVPTHDLTDDEQKVVAHVRTVGKIQTKGVCKLLGCAETKGNGILKTLVDNCVFERFGKGRATAYRLAD